MAFEDVLLVVRMNLSVSHCRIKSFEVVLMGISGSVAAL
jgi:hypothetical protein